ncbi:MAG: toll/interleukin-1 receptor domain-containing protein [Proteobacteria bacterium]|nr:toll/interleukin-1 receptor domain-containing protein [Pseudomonadota bacterium]MBU4297194.1 toll/interleukin-1 receptor domain-containing protein [Pseudomonadota bacterium]MCG2750087.1 toll/interleukin-1 receptor domain-containing protein [Desulfobulbaceae bacterium]
MSKIFISYAREDEEKAQTIAQQLEKAGRIILIDRRIPAGAEWAPTLESQLKEARYVVVLWSRHSVNSFWVRSEAAEGLEQNKLIPVLLDKANLPRIFRNIQTDSLENWDGNSSAPELKQFLDRLKENLISPVFSGLENVASGQAITAENLTLIHSSWRRLDKDEEHSWRPMYQIHLILYGKPAVLDRVQSVTYRLHGYPANRIEQQGGTRAQNFELKELAWGQSYIRADVFIIDQAVGRPNPLRLYQFVTLHDSGPRLATFFDRD